MEDDLELLEAWRAGDRAAGQRLIGRYFDSIARFFRSKLGDDVEDLIQSTFADCIAASRRLTITASFRAYLFSIARHRLIDHLRSAARRHDTFDVEALSLADLGTSPSGKLARSEEHRLLLEAMNRIPLEQQMVLELTYWENLPGSEVAVILDIDDNTVRSRLSRARAALREELARSTGAHGTRLLELLERS